MKSRKFEFTVSSPSEAVVELSDEGLYVRFKSGVNSARTIVRSRWPLVAIDLDTAGNVIGIECTPVPAEFGLTSVAKLANVSVSAETISGARYLRAASVAQTV
jgi:uncharacterized protein YuzE